MYMYIYIHINGGGVFHIYIYIYKEIIRGCWQKVPEKTFHLLNNHVNLMILIVQKATRLFACQSTKISVF